MGCGCRGGSSAVTAGQWVHTRPDGEREPYATEWEARSAAEASGGTYRWVSAGQG